MANYWDSLSKKTTESGLDPTAAQTAGLTKAYELMGGAGQTAYPTTQAPTAVDYYELTPYQPLKTLTGGDYDKLREGLTSPIYTQSKHQKDYLEDVYSGQQRRL